MLVAVLASHLKDMTMMEKYGDNNDGGNTYHERVLP